MLFKVCSVSNSGYPLYPLHISQLKYLRNYMYVCMNVVILVTFSCNVCLHRMTSYYWSGERMIKLLQLNTSIYKEIYFNRGQQRQVLWRPAKPLTSRLPEPSRARRELKHSRDTQYWLEERGKLEACNKHYKRPSNSRNWTVLCGVIAERREWTTDSKMDSDEELHSVERGKRIC